MFYSWRTTVGLLINILENKTKWILFWKRLTYLTSLGQNIHHFLIPAHFIFEGLQKSIWKGVI